MLARALDAGVPAAWVTADEAYGHDSKFRRFLASRRIGYVVAIPCSQPVHNGQGSLRADTLAADAPPQAWKRLSCGDGSKGQRLYDWAMASLPGHEDRYDRSRWLLIRRSVSNPDELAYYLCSGPDGTTIDTLIKIAGTRWRIETCFRDAKTETGLDHYQVRQHDAWYRHITLSMLGLRLPNRLRGGRLKSSSDLAALSPGEIRRLLAHIMKPIAPQAFCLAWSHWRRRRQADARRSHHRRQRLKHLETSL